MNRKDTEMINNNLDFDKYSNHTITTTTTTATLNTQLPSTPPSPPSALTAITTTATTTTNSNTKSSRTKQQQQTTTTSSTSSSSSSSSSSSTTSSSTRFANAMPSSAASAASAVTAAASNYFQRFDNRIAANLAAVLNGSRFRSSSVGGRSSPARSAASRQANAANAANANVATVGAHVNVAMPQTPQTLRRSRHDDAALHMQLNNYAPGQGAKGAGGGGGGFFGDVDGNDCGSGSGSETGSMGRQRPQQLFAHGNLNCNDNEKLPRSSQTSSQTTPPSSDEDNSPTELNNCKRLADKPPLVKRLTMGLLRGHEESRPLVQGGSQTATAPDALLGGMAGSCTTSTSSSSSAPSAPCLDGELDLDEVYGKRSLKHMFPGGAGGADGGCGSNQLYSNGYINEEAFEPEKYIASKFGDSCRQSLTAIPMLDTMNLNDNSEFNLKKRYLRETSSANSSPKIFANRLRMNASSSRYTNGGGGGATTCSNSSGYGSAGNRLLMPTDDDDEAELKEASWFQAGISRDIAVEVLASKSPGAFLVRKSSSKPGCYALTLRVPSPPGPKIANYIILRTARGYKIKGFRKEFTSLKALITHHSVMPELLPVPLAMPRPTNMTSSRRNLDDFDTYDSLQMLLKYLRAKNMENE